jgi:uncharacterized protein (DUF849 family)
MMSKVVVTCALTGVLTDPAQHHVPVTPEQMAREARAAFDAGATVMHVHFRQQAPGTGHLPSWEPQARSRSRRRSAKRARAWSSTSRRAS